jgi:hypothetical protein
VEHLLPSLSVEKPALYQNGILIKSYYEMIDKDNLQEGLEFFHRHIVNVMIAKFFEN